MNPFDDNPFPTLRVAAPEGMYEQVRQRILQERTRIDQTRHRLLWGVALLLIVGSLNMGLILWGNPSKPTLAKEQTEEMLLKTYFDNTIQFYE